MSQQRVTFEVSGSGRFPIDMLRYDSCWPSTEQDAGRIARTLGRGERGQWAVTITGQRSPTTGRWQSFGCLVGEVE